METGYSDKLDEKFIEIDNSSESGVEIYRRQQMDSAPRQTVTPYFNFSNQLMTFNDFVDSLANQLNIYTKKI